MLPIRTTTFCARPAVPGTTRSDVIPKTSPSGIARGTSTLSYEAGAPALPVGTENGTSVGPAEVCSDAVKGSDTPHSIVGDSDTENGVVLPATVANERSGYAEVPAP